jgi:hypothetical protein
LTYNTSNYIDTKYAFKFVFCCVVLSVICRLQNLWTPLIILFHLVLPIFHVYDTRILILVKHRPLFMEWFIRVKGSKIIAVRTHLRMVLIWSNFVSAGSWAWTVPCNIQCRPWTDLSNRVYKISNFSFFAFSIEYGFVFFFLFRQKRDQINTWYKWLPGWIE